MNTRNKRTKWWKVAAMLILAIAVIISLFSIFYVPGKPSETIRSNIAPVTQESTDESVLSGSVDTNTAYEDALTVAQAACERAGYSVGSTAYDECTEREISQNGH